MKLSSPQTTSEKKAVFDIEDEEEEEDNPLLSRDGYARLPAAAQYTSGHMSALDDNGDDDRSQSPQTSTSKSTIEEQTYPTLCLLIPYPELPVGLKNSSKIPP